MKAIRIIDKFIDDLTTILLLLVLAPFIAIIALIARF